LPVRGHTHPTHHLGRQSRRSGSLHVTSSADGRSVDPSHSRANLYYLSRLV
jgi:hypothetical protein